LNRNGEKGKDFRNEIEGEKGKREQVFKNEIVREKGERKGVGWNSWFEYFGRLKQV
jgi:hypothetical protein